MEPLYQALRDRLDRLPDQFRELRDGVHQGVLVADIDPEMALTRVRKVLEYLVPRGVFALLFSVQYELMTVFIPFLTLSVGDNPTPLFLTMAGVATIFVLLPLMGVGMLGFWW